MDNILSKSEPATPAQMTILNQSFLWMFAGLFVTGVVSFVVLSVPALAKVFVTNQFVYLGLLIAQVLLVIYLSVRVMKMTFGAALAAFFAYAALNGLTLSAIFAYYTASSIAVVFFISAAIFGVMAAIGYTTKKDLTSLGMLAFAGLIGVIIASLVNMFLRSDSFSYFLSYITIIIFLGLVAYDTQKLKRLSSQTTNANVGVIGALMLYLDFINIFINLLRIFGRTR